MSVNVRLFVIVFVDLSVGDRQSLRPSVPVPLSFCSTLRPSLHLSKRVFLSAVPHPFQRIGIPSIVPYPYPSVIAFVSLSIRAFEVRPSIWSLTPTFDPLLTLVQGKKTAGKIGR